jgi:signal transduction histidine kinase
MILAVIAMLVIGAVLAPLIFGVEFDRFDEPGRTARQLRQSFGRAMFGALLVGFVSAAGAASIMARYVARRITGPIQEAGRATRKLAEGDYSVRVPTAQATELARLAEDINLLATELAEVEQRRLQLIGEVAHELRTPLTTIEGSMEALLDGVVEPSDEVFAGIAEQAARLKRLAFDLSSLSRSEEVAYPLDREELDLSEVVTQVVETLRPQFEANEVVIDLDADARVLVPGDSDRLTQVFTNVIGNALSYTGEDGEVDVRVIGSGRQAVVTVGDTGIGLGPEDCERIFERFYRVDERRATGTGVGLTIARALIRAHGGEITATSPGPGRGSTFTITLPKLR